MSDTPHSFVPCAVLPTAGGQEALARLQLPHLERLLARLSLLHHDSGDEDAPDLPHERALARALGLLATAGGALPWAAWHARQSAAAAGAAPGGAAWAFVTPCHWQVRTDHVTLDDPAALQLDEAASRELLAVLAPWFVQDGITLHYDQPTRWLAEGAPLANLATASLERVLHRDLRMWLPDPQRAAHLHRLQSEMQMLLYTHPLNDAREARGLPTVNAFWLHGAGALPAAAAPVPGTKITVHSELRTPALQEDWPAWVQAWQALDAGPIAAMAAQAARGEAVQLTLSGERSAFTWHSAPRSLRQKIAGIFRPQRFADLGRQL